MADTMKRDDDVRQKPTGTQGPGGQQQPEEPRGSAGREQRMPGREDGEKTGGGGEQERREEGDQGDVGGGGNE